MSNHTLSMWLVLFSPLTLILGAEENLQPVRQAAPDVPALIKRLSSEVPQTREEAQAKLIALGALAVPEVRKALESADPEVKTRAQTILVEIDRVALRQRKDLLKSFAGGPKEAFEKVIRTEEEWAGLLESCTGKELQNTLRKLRLDFSKHMLVAVSLGPFDSCLSKSEIETVGIKEIVPDVEKWLVGILTGDSDKKSASEYPLWLTLLPKTEQAIEFKKKGFNWGG